MQPEVESLIENLSSFKPEDELANVDRLHQIFDGFDNLPEEVRARAMPAMFSLLERNPEGEFGSPGPIVHALEDIAGYQPLLRDSLARQPTYLTLWMVNRILNSNLSKTDRQAWLDCLNSVSEHPNAPAVVKDEAAAFIAHQAERGDA